MLNPRVASRYAKSLLDLAVERNQLEKVYEDMQYMHRLIKGSRDFLNVFRSPIIHSDAKMKVVDAVLKGNAGELTISFIRLLITKTRETVLPEVITSFIQQYKKHKEIYTIKITTASPLSEEVKNAIINQVKKTSNMKNIEVEEKVDPNIVGGFVLQAGDKLVDASIAYDLKAIARQFDNNDFIYKVR